MERFQFILENKDLIPMELQVDFCIKLLLAVLLGCLLGVERTKKYKSAGVRIYGLVAAGSCLVMIISKFAFLDMPNSGDPSRVAASVISGISFICIAIIYRQGTALRGLSTAAGLWCVSAIGLAVGGGLYVPAVFATILVFILQSVMHRLHIDNDSMTQREVTIIMDDDDEIRKAIRSELHDVGCDISGRKVAHHADGTLEYTFVLKLSSRLHFEDAIAMICKHTQVHSISMQ